MILCEMSAKCETSLRAGNKYSGSDSSVSSFSSGSDALVTITDSKNDKTSFGAYRSLASSPVVDEMLALNIGAASGFGFVLIFIASKRCRACDDCNSNSAKDERTYENENNAKLVKYLDSHDVHLFSTNMIAT